MADGSRRIREAYLHPDNRYIVACLIGAAVIDDPREFGGWCKHGFELLRQFQLADRDEATLYAKAQASMEQQPSMVMAGDRIPMAENTGPGPNADQAARWQERFARNAAAGRYTAPDGEAMTAQFTPAQPVQQPAPGQISALVQDLVRQELARLQESSYGASVMPQAQPAWPTPVIRPTPQWTGAAPTPGYVPGRRY